MNKYTTALQELSEIGFQEFVKDKGNKAVIMEALGVMQSLVKSSEYNIAAVGEKPTVDVELMKIWLNSLNATVPA